MRSTMCILLVPFLAVMCVQSVLAQVDRGTITGTVVDQNGANIPAVHVVATNTATGANYEANSNQLGIYSVVNLPIGSYSVTFMHEGFSVLHRTNLHLVAAQVLEANVKLQVGSNSESVTVSAVASLLDTQTSTLGTTLETQDMTDLPLDVSGGRDASKLLYSTTPTMVGGTYIDHIAGSPSFSKTVLIDGTDGNNGMQGFVFTPGMDAIQEMQAQVSGIQSEGAGTGGGVLMYKLKSGTNKFHGSAFGFMHNEAFDANTWSNKYFLAQCATGDTACRQANKNSFNRFTDFGASAGGPIWKNHTFIFGDYERYNSTNLNQNPIGATVPTQQMLNGDFSQLLTRGNSTGNVTDPYGNIIMPPQQNLWVVSGSGNLPSV